MKKKMPDADFINSLSPIVENTAPAVAKALGISRNTALKRLRSLCQQKLIICRKVGNYWTFHKK